MEEVDVRKLSLVLGMVFIFQLLCMSFVGANDTGTSYLYSEDFEKFNEGAIVGQSGWAADNTGNGMIVTDSEKGKVLKVQRPSDTDPATRGARRGLATPISVEDQHAIIECDFKVVKGSTTANTQILNISDSGRQICNILVNPSTGVVMANWKGTEKIRENSWNKLKVIVDLTPGVGNKAKTTAYLNDVLIVQDVEGVNDINTGKLNAISFVQNSSCDAEIFFDNIKVSNAKGTSGGSTEPKADSVTQPTVGAQDTPNAVQVYSETFDAFNEGAVAGQRFWAADNMGSGIIVTDSEKGKVLQVQRPSDTDPATRGVRIGLNTPVSVVDQYAIIECDFKVKKGSTAANTQIFNLTDTGRQICNILVNPSTGVLQVNWKGSEKIRENSWNKLKLIIDLTPGVGNKAKTTAYLNDVLIAQDVEGVNDINTGKINSLSFVQNSTCDAEIFFDNIKVFKGVSANNASQSETSTTQPADEDFLEKFKESVILYLGESKALVNNKETSIDSNNPEVVPFAQDGRTLVPVRFISESLGADVDWDASTSTVTVKMGQKTIKMVLGNKAYTIDGEEKTLDVPAQTISGRTVIPLRAIVEALGKKVFWDDRGLIIISDIENIISRDKDELLILQLIQKLKK